MAVHAVTKSTSTLKRCWNSGTAFSRVPRQDDKQALLEEKLGPALPISYEDWLKDCHYEKLDAKLTRWLYQQERGFVESLKDVTLEEIAHQRIDEFTTTLKKYIL